MEFICPEAHSDDLADHLIISDHLVAEVVTKIVHLFYSQYSGEQVVWLVRSQVCIRSLLVT